jgi:methylamine dehydrogenase accessory protein MauD
VVLWILVALLCVTVVALARQIGTLHLRLGPRGALEVDDEGPPLGEALDPVPLTDVRARPVTLAARGERQLLLFVSPGCSTCHQVLPALPAVAGHGEIAPYVLCDGDREDAELLARERRPRAPVVPAGRLAKELELPGAPFALVLDEQGVVRAKGTVNDLEQMEGLTDTAWRRLEEAPRERAA